MSKNQNLFNSVQLQKPNSNRFDLSHDIKTSMQMGYLVPTMCLEAVPGDNFHLACESLVRLQPLVSPMMHRLDVTTHYFFVPNRLLWPHWEDFITNNSGDLPMPAFPYLQIDKTIPITYPLADYFGIPSQSTGSSNERISALPFAAYQMIFNEYYRDENLIAEVPFELVNGLNNANAANLLQIRRRAWEHDYFTSALPFAQKGDGVDLPLGDVILKPTWHTAGDIPYWQDEGLTPATAGTISAATLPDDHIEGSGAAGVDLAYDPNGSLTVTATTINDLRRAEAIQKWLERMALGGTRYTELIRAMFGVTSDDARLQRPEYITGAKSPVIVGEVLNTTGTTTLPQGNMAGHGMAVVDGNFGSYFCKEHGYIIGITSVLPKTAYQQGIPKHFLKLDDPTQYFFPQFAHIGEQEVLNRELYAYTTTGGEPFGYVPRYSEYKFEPNRVSGDMRSNLDFWHMGREFSAQPALNEAFINCVPTERVFAVTDPTIDKVIMQIFNKVSVSRLMPKFGTPML